MGYDATSGLWTPDASTTGTSTTPASSTPTADNLNGLLTQGSPYIDQAKSAGMDVANQRGLQNSSIASGASESAAIGAAEPIAANDASIDATKQEQATQIASTQDIAGANIQAAATQQAGQIAATQKLADQSQGTQLQVANMNVSSDQQDKAAAAAVSYANVYSSIVNSIDSNTTIPADARAAYLQNAQTLYNNGMSLVEQTYNVQLDWGQNGGTSAAAGTAPLSTDGSAPVSSSANYATPTDAASGVTDNTVAYTNAQGTQFNSAGQQIGSAGTG